MQVHGLIALFTSASLHESRTHSLNLNAASSLLLDVLDIGAAVANNLSAEIETWDWLKIDRNFFLRPLALLNLSVLSVYSNKT